MQIKSFLLKLATDKYQGFFAGIAKLFLWLLSLVYGVGVRLWAWRETSRAVSLPCKVISVGNLTLGGTGKTILVELLARQLTLQGHKVAVVSRGYKRFQGQGDEPKMLKEKLRDVAIIVDADRVRGAHTAVEGQGADTVILDDAFQQWRVKKDLEIVTLDAECPFGNGHLIPRGILREPLAALRRADIAVITESDFSAGVAKVRDRLAGINPQALIVEACRKPVDFYDLYSLAPMALKELKHLGVGLISGIAAPDSFEKIVESLGGQITFHLRFPDHYLYQAPDIQNIFKECRGKNVQLLLTTEKDAVRLKWLTLRPQVIRILVLRIRMELTNNEEGFRSRLAGLYRA